MTLRQGVARCKSTAAPELSQLGRALAWGREVLLEVGPAAKSIQALRPLTFLCRYIQGTKTGKRQPAV